MVRGSLIILAAQAFFFLGVLIVAPGVQGIGVNYGMLGNNLPSPSDVISLCKSRNINMVRIYGPNLDALAALRNTGIGVIVGASMPQLKDIGTNPAAAAGWVRDNILPFAGSVYFRYINMGNEENMGSSGGYILPAIYNVFGALQAVGLNIPVTTAVSTNVIATSYPPSQGSFSDQSLQVLGPIISLLASRNTPLMVNVYPYFTYATNPGMRLDYALFTANGVVVQDGNLGYSNLFDAMVDTIRSALQRVGGSNVDVVVSESGWPSAGANAATVDNARTYMNNLVNHVKSNAGTPKFPGKQMEVYLFSLFNENLKAQGTEQNFGMFYPNKNEVYHVNF